MIRRHFCQPPVPSRRSISFLCDFLRGGPRLLSRRPCHGHFRFVLWAFHVDGQHPVRFTPPTSSLAFPPPLPPSFPVTRSPPNRHEVFTCLECMAHNAWNVWSLPCTWLSTVKTAVNQRWWMENKEEDQLQNVHSQIQKDM